MFVNSLEYWSFEMLFVLSGLLPKPQLEMSVLSIWYVIAPSGMSTDESHKVSLGTYVIFLFCSLTFLSTNLEVKSHEA